MKLIDLFEDRPPIDNISGLGAVGASGNIDYLGLRVQIKPSVFLKLAAPHPDPRSDYIEKHVAAGEPIGAPFLDIHIPEEWFSEESRYDQVIEGDLSAPANIIGHEGRHRMSAILKHYGDELVETHILLRGLRRRHMTDNMIARLNESVISQTGKLSQGPWFEMYTVSENVAESNSMPVTFKIKRRKLNVPALIKAGAIFVTYPHGEQGWETDDKEVWSYSLISLYNVQQGGWTKDARKYLKPESYTQADQDINSSAPNLGTNKLVYDGKYNQILWSIKKLGIADNVAFLDNAQTVTENFADGKGPGKPGDSARHGIPKNATLTQLDSIGRGKGRKAQLARWQANMRRGRKRAAK